MPSEEKPKKADKPKKDDAKPKAEKSDKPAGKEKKAKDKDKGKDQAAAEAAPAPAKAAPPPRPPADPRLKVLKKFQGRFLPKGPLRDRLKAIMERWNSGEDHGGVTVEELKALLADWRASREKKSKARA